MLKQTLFVSALVLAAVAPVTGSALNLAPLAAKAGAAKVAKRLPSNYPVINEILINPKSGSHKSSFIALKCPANFNLNNYAIVVVENENGGGSTDGRGTIDNIIPLDGYSADSNGNFVVREADSSGNLALLGETVSPFTGADPFVGLSNEMKLDFSAQYSISNFHSSGITLNYGGNSLENEGGNYFLVYNLNPNATQQHTDGSGNKVNGTVLDSTPNSSNGTFDAQRNVRGAFVLADHIYDGFYVGEGTDDGGANNTSLDYVTNTTIDGNGTRAVFPLMKVGSNWGYNTNHGTQTQSDWGHTPDYVCRIWDGSTPTSNSVLTHNSLNAVGTSVTIDDTFGTEVNTSGNYNQFFKKASSGLQVLWDLTDESSIFNVTGYTFASPTFPFSIASTYYHP